MLTKEQLTGMWVAVPTVWDENGNFNEKVFRENIAMLVDAGANGLYITGTTGEFYAMDLDEFKIITNVFLDETAGKIPVQVGTNCFNTRDTIRQIRYARDKGADAVQFCFPSWMEMPQEHYDQFIIDIYQAVPDIALIHYNTIRTKKLFHGRDYVRLIPHIPTLIGSKAAMSLDDFMELVVYAPELNHFVGETKFALASRWGAKGMYTSWFMMNPDFFHDYYEKCINNDPQAIEISKRLIKWHKEGPGQLSKKGYRDPTIDKAYIVMAGWLPGNRYTRKPYMPITDEEFEQLKRTTEKFMPEFLSYKS